MLKYFLNKCVRRGGIGVGLGEERLTNPESKQAEKKTQGNIANCHEHLRCGEHTERLVDKGAKRGKTTAEANYEQQTERTVSVAISVYQTR